MDPLAVLAYGAEQAPPSLEWNGATCIISYFDFGFIDAYG